MNATDATADAAPAASVPGGAASLFTARILAAADRHRRWVLGAAVVLLLAGFNGQWRPEPDAALYLTIGRSIAEGDGYRYHGASHPLAYPGLPWMWAGLFRIAPDHAVLLAHGLILLTALGCLALTYRLILLHAGRPTAVVVTFGLAITRMFYRYALELRSDVPFLLGVLGVLVGFESLFYSHRSTRRQRLRIDGPLLVAGLALAVVTRPTMWALLAAVATTIVLGVFAGRLKAGLVLLAAVVGVGAVMARLDPRSAPHGMGEYEQTVLSTVQHVSTLSHRVLGENLPSLLSPAAAEALFGIDFGGQTGVAGISLNTIPSLLVLALGLSLFRYRLLWGMLFAWTVLMVLAVLALDRYLLPVLPLLVFAWWGAMVWLERTLPRRWGAAAVLGLLAIGGATNLPRLASLVGEQRMPDTLAHYRGGKYAFAPGLGREIERLTPAPAGGMLDGPWVVGPARYGRILSYYSRRWVEEAGRPEHAGGVPPEKIFVLNPSEPDVALYLSERHLRAGEAIGGTAPWTIHRVERVAR